MGIGDNICYVMCQVLYIGANQGLRQFTVHSCMISLSQISHSFQIHRVATHSDSGSMSCSEGRGNMLLLFFVLVVIYECMNLGLCG